MDLNYSVNGFNATSAQSVYWFQSDIFLTLLFVIALGIWIQVILTLHLWMLGSGRR